MRQPGARAGDATGVHCMAPKRSAACVPVVPRLRPGGTCVRSQDPLPFPLGVPGCRFTRDAARVMPAALRAMGLVPGHLILVPALHHGPEVQALRRAGLETRTYGTGDAVAPVAEELEALAGSAARALYIIHQIGFPQPADRWRAWCGERGLVLIEDCTHAWPAALDGDRPVGSSGGLAVFSFGTMLPPPAADAVVARLQNGSSAWGRYPRAEGRLRLAASRHLDADIADRRRSNYRRLADEIGETVARPFAEVPDGSCPWVLPVVDRRPAALLERLDRAGIGAVELWGGARSSLTPWLGDGAVGVPVHQGLRERELDRIAAAVRGPRRRPPVRIELLPDFDAAGDVWDELAAASGNFFATREWLGTWWRHYGSGEPLLVACKVGGRITAILPLEVTWLHGARILRFLGSGPSDQMGPICRRADVGTAARALRQLLMRPPRRFQLFVGRHLSGADDWGALLGATRLREVADPVLPLQASTWEEVLASFSPKLRKEIRYDVRRLEREHVVEYRRTEHAASLEADLDTLLALHAAQWQERSYFLGHEAFHRDFAAIAHRRGWLRLWIVEVDGRPVAAKYNFRFGDAELSYQAGRDPGWRGPSLGLVNIANAMRAAVGDGVREYRFLRGSERYKFRFPVTDAGLHTVARGSGVLGRTALAAGAGLEGSEALQAAWRTMSSRADSTDARLSGPLSAARLRSNQPMEISG